MQSFIVVAVVSNRRNSHLHIFAIGFSSFSFRSLFFLHIISIFYRHCDIDTELKFEFVYIS